MKTPPLLLLFLLAGPVSAQDDGAQKPDAEKALPAPQKKPAVEIEAGETRVAPLQAREVIERLKTLRAQILMEEEYNRLLEARVHRLELEEKYAAYSNGGAAPAKKKGEGPPKLAGLPPPPAALEAADRLLTVKSVTVAPFKEAFVVFKGRTYTVRPGDTLGDLSIRDITENGVVTNRSSVMLEP